MEVTGGELLGEELGLAQGHGLEGGHHHEGGPAVGKEATDRLGPLDEAGVHRLEEDEELGDVLQELGAEDAVGDLVEGPGGHVDQARSIGDDQPSQEPGREEVGHALGGVEEVESVAGRRRVDDDEVVVALGVDLVEPLHGDVVVTLDEARRDVPVERVGQNLVAGAAVGRVAANEGVPRLLRVEHGRPQLAPRPDAGGPEGLVGDPVLLVADAVEAEGIGQPPGRVDGEHEHLAAVADGGHARRRRRPWSSCPRRPVRSRRRSPWRPAARRGWPGRRSPATGTRLRSAISTRAPRPARPPPAGWSAGRGSG